MLQQSHESNTKNKHSTSALPARQCLASATRPASRHPKGRRHACAAAAPLPDAASRVARAAAVELLLDAGGHEPPAKPLARALARAARQSRPGTC